MQLFFAILCKNANEVFNKNSDNIPHKIFDDECLHQVIWTSWVLKFALNIEWFLLILFFNCNQILNFGTPLVQGITTLYLILGVHSKLELLISIWNRNWNQNKDSTFNTNSNIWRPVQMTWFTAFLIPAVLNKGEFIYHVH